VCVLKSRSCASEFPTMAWRMRSQSSRMAGEVNLTSEQCSFRARESGLVESGLRIFPRNSSPTIADRPASGVSNAPIDVSPVLRLLRLMAMHFWCRFAFYFGRFETGRDEGFRGDRQRAIELSFQFRCADPITSVNWMTLLASNILSLVQS
jgi:hypothetical protein